MHTCARHLTLIIAAIWFCTPSSAEVLLNCRLMEADTDPLFRNGCKWETISRKCVTDRVCTLKRQNIISASAKQALEAPALRSAVLSRALSPSLAAPSEASAAGALNGVSLSASAPAANGGVLGAATGALSDTADGVAGALRN